jgi:hypothetical protein
MVAATYVRDIDVSRDFYALLGFDEQSAGRSETSAWSSLRHGDHSVLLVATVPPLDIPELPLLFYFFVDDLETVVGALTAASVPLTHVGYPPHALGGEVKVVDPDGNTVLLGQAERSPSQSERIDDERSPQFSLLREAAAVVATRGGAPASCQVRNLDRTPCRRKAEVKLADASGGTVWACIIHADEILVSVGGAFIANVDEHVIETFLARRRA